MAETVWILAAILIGQLYYFSNLAANTYSCPTLFDRFIVDQYYRVVRSQFVLPTIIV